MEENEDNAPAAAQARESGLSAAARRALAEAEARRRAARLPLPPEVGGREGPDPVRHGDWEVRGIASDF